MGEKSWFRQATTTMMKMAPSKSVLIRFNLVLFALSFLLYTALLLRPSSSVYFENAASLVGCSFRECHPKVERGVKMQELMEDSQINNGDLQTSNKTNLTKLDVPSFVEDILRKGFGRPRIGMVNMDDTNISEWKRYGETILIHFDRVSELFKWQDLFPEWIDEEEETDVPTCPEISIPDLSNLDKMDVIVAKLPCNYPEEGWRREVGRLQVHLVAANLAAKKAKRDWRWRTTVVFWSKCRPMIEIFRCDDLVRREGDWWLYRPEVVRLQQKLDLPVGSCNLALPLWGRQGNFPLAPFFFLSFSFLILKSQEEKQ